MNKFKLFLGALSLILVIYTEGSSQVAINTNGAPAGTNTMLDLNPAIGKAFVPPKMTYAQIKAISPATEGMMVYDTEFKSLRLYNGTKWVALTQQSDITAAPGSLTAQTATGTVFINAVTTDASGNVYTTGSFVGTVSFGTVSLTGSGSCSEFFLAKYNSSGVIVWVQKSTSNKTSGNTAEGLALVVDAAGNIYATGTFFADLLASSNLVFGSLTGIWSVPSSGSGGDIFIVKYDINGVAQWAIREGGEGQTSDYGTSITVDNATPTNNVIVAGTYCPNPSAVPVGVSIGNTSFAISNALNNAFVAKYNSSGVGLWAKNVDSNQSARGTSVAVDGTGNVYYTGFFIGNAIYNSTTTASTGFYDGFIIKYNSAGTFQWFSKPGGTGNDYVFGITTDGTSGNLYVTGSISSSVTLATSPSTTLTSAGFDDIFVAKYNTSGVPQWAKRAGGSGDDFGYSIAIDASSNLYVTGSFTGTAAFGSLPTSITASGGSNDKDIFLAKYNSSGVEQWALKAGGTGNDYGRKTAVDATGNVYTTGSFVASAQFGNTVLATGTTFLMKYSE
jgi:hypothetical protein